MKNFFKSFWRKPRSRQSKCPESKKVLHGHYIWYLWSHYFKHNVPEKFPFQCTVSSYHPFGVWEYVLNPCTIIISPLRGSKYGGFDAVWRDHNYCAPSGLKGLLYCHPGLAAWAIVYRPFRALKSHHLMLSPAERVWTADSNSPPLEGWPPWGGRGGWIAEECPARRPNGLNRWLIWLNDGHD